MLTIKAPIELKTRNFHLRDDGGFHERIRGDYALMGSGGAHLIELPAIHGNHHGPRFLGQRGQPGQSAVGAALSDVDLVDRAAAFQRLGQRVAAFNQTLGELVRSFVRLLPSPDVASRRGIFLLLSVKSLVIHSNMHTFS